MHEIIKEKTKTKKNVMEKKADDKTVVGDLNHLPKKGVQEAEINDDKYIAAGGEELTEIERKKSRDIAVSLLRSD
ncbi:hypothetical protein AgCh_034068 [Apium graveolens]